MRSSSGAITTALANAPHAGLVPLRFVTIWAPDKVTGTVDQFCYWSEPVPAAVAIADRDTGSLVSRSFEGGALLAIGKVNLTTGIRLKQWTFTLNVLTASVRNLVMNHDLRRGIVEYHRDPGDPVSRLPVDAPARRFYGTVEAAEQARNARGELTSIQISCASNSGQFTHRNNLKRSDVAQKRRSGDRQMQYVDTCADWDIAWGEASGAVK